MTMVFWSCSQGPEGGSPSAAPAAAPTAPQLASTDLIAQHNDNLVEIPAGSFLYGATEKQFEFYLGRSVVSFAGMAETLRSVITIPPRDISMGRFYIDAFEVTNEQYQEFLRSSSYSPSERTGYLKHWISEKNYPDWAAGFPVVWISQEDARAYCRWRGGRLPSEQEWEKASRGTDQRYFPWGDIHPLPETANYGTRKAEPAGNRAGDRSPFDVYDLGANVAEFTSSLQNVGGVAQVVVRGGSFLGMEREMLTFHKDFVLPATRAEHIGFRCVLDQTR